MQLPPLDDSFAKHVYVSRQHANAQEQSGLVKNLLVTMLPTCKVRARARVRVRARIRVRVRVRVRIRDRSRARVRLRATDSGEGRG